MDVNKTKGYKLSVIVPIFNAEKYIERCPRSLFEQTLDRIQYVIVDDCTPDNSINILKSIIEDYPGREKDVTIIKHQMNTGQSGAGFDGLKAAGGGM